MKKISLLLFLFLLVACSKSEENPNQYPQQNNEEQTDDGTTNNDDPPIPFEPYNLKILADTGPDGDIILMNINAGGTAVSLENITTASGLNVNDVLDFRESDRLTWFDAYNNIDYPIFQKNLNNETTFSYIQLCNIVDENIKFITYGNGTIVMGSEYFNPTNNTIQSNFRAKGADYDCVLTSYENYTTLSGTIIGSKLLCFVENQMNSSDKKIVKFNLTNATLEGEINFETLGSYATDGQKLYVFSNNTFYKYDIDTFNQESSTNINYYFNEKIGFFEAEFFGDKMLIHTGYPQPSPYSTGITVLNKNTGEVFLNTANTDFLSNLTLNLHAAYPNVSNFGPTTINYSIEDGIILIGTYDLDTGRNFIVYTNIDSELLQVIEIPYPAKKIFFRS